MFAGATTAARKHAIPPTIAAHTTDEAVRPTAMPATAAPWTPGTNRMSPPERQTYVRTPEMPATRSRPLRALAAVLRAVITTTQPGSQQRGC